VNVLFQSPWFKRALDAGVTGKDGEIATIDLWEHHRIRVHAKEFKLYQTYLYTKTIAPDAEMLTLLHALIAANTLSDEAFMQAVLDRVDAEHQDRPSLCPRLKGLNLLYGCETLRVLPLRKLFLDFYIARAPAPSKENFEGMRNDLKYDIVAAFFAKRDSQGSSDALT
jgi:hypothetical protein